MPTMQTHVMDAAQRIAFNTTRLFGGGRGGGRAAQPPGTYVEMTLEMPSFALPAGAFDDDDDDDDDDDAAIDSFNAAQPSRRRPGLVAATKLPVTTYQSVEHPNKDEACPICMEHFEAGCIVRELPCKHIFHDSCVLKWFVKDDTCPKCRATISPTSRLPNATVAGHRHTQRGHRLDA